MRIKESYDGNTVEFIGGGEIIAAILGLFFLLICGGLIIAPLQNKMPPGTTPIVYVFGSITFLLGLVLIFGRKGIKVDLTFGEVSIWWGMAFLPLRSIKRLLTDFSHIEMRILVHHSKNRTYHTYPVCLCPESGKEYKLTNPKDILLSRNFAEKSAKLLQISLIDKSGTVVIERKYDELDLSIREQAEKKNEIPHLADIGEIPDSLKEFGGITDGNLLLEMPPSKLGQILKKLLIIPFLLAVVLFPVLCFFMKPGQDGGGPWAFFYIVIAFFIIPLPIVFFVLRGKLRRFGDITKIYARKDYLEICYGEKVMAWEAADIEEMILLPRGEMPDGMPDFLKNLPIPGNGGITVRSDKLYATFGFRLNTQEQEWVFKVLYAILAGRKQGI